jgi:hypothetical protein
VDAGQDPTPADEAAEAAAAKQKRLAEHEKDVTGKVEAADSAVRQELYNAQRRAVAEVEERARRQQAAAVAELPKLLAAPLARLAVGQALERATRLAPDLSLDDLNTQEG